MHFEDFPDLYQCADRASRSAQNIHVYLFGASLILLMAGGLVSALSPSSAFAKLAVSYLALLLLFLSFVCWLVIGLIRKDKVWYSCRAVAESCKTLAWRYMTAAEPYSVNTNSVHVDAAFVDDLRKLVSAQKDVSKDLTSSSTGGAQITSRMRQVRSASLEQRVQAYLLERIADQAEWYRLWARSNHRVGEKLFWITIGLQLIAILFGVFRTVNPDELFHASSVLAAVATATIAWSQFRKYQDLSQSYGVAAQELALIREKGGTVNSDQALSEFVREAETAISREHTMWLARR